MRNHKSLIAVAILIAVALVSSLSIALADTPTDVTGTTVVPAVPSCAKFTLKDHNKLIDQTFQQSVQTISKGKRKKNAAMVNCAVPGTSAEMQRDWQKADAKHHSYVHDVLAYPGGENPVGGHKWPLPYCIVVGESGAGSGSSNLYGMLDGWAYRPSWAPASVYDASFWAQSVAAYNLRQYGFGGWSTWPC